MSYEKYYPNGWQSGESGGTPITPEALDHIEEGIQDAVCQDGSSPMTGDLDMGSHRVKNLAAPEEDADAVNLGYLNKNCAPAGFGLGKTTGKECSDCNKATANGFYSLAGEIANGPGYYVGYGNLLALNRRDGSHIAQIGTYANTFASRCFIDDWGDWRWLNARMVLGVEYHTLEHWNGKDVYCFNVEFGALPNSTYKTLTLPVSMSQLIRYNLVNQYSDLALTGNKNIQVNASGSTLQITTNTDLSAHRAICGLWYTKD